MNSKIIIIFDTFFKNFKSSHLWVDMQNTVENSPWHRENSVAVHTQMILDWYQKNLMAHRSDRQILLTMIAAVFHDVGKPPSEIIKHSETRGEYRAYHGHENVSANMWLDYAVQNYESVKYDLRFSDRDISGVALMIEYHLPYCYKDPKKRKAIKTAMFSRLGEDGHRAWLDLLLSDQHGRIGDNQKDNEADLHEWLAEWTNV